MSRPGGTPGPGVGSSADAAPELGCPCRSGCARNGGGARRRSCTGLCRDAGPLDDDPAGWRGAGMHGLNAVKATGIGSMRRHGGCSGERLRPRCTSPLSRRRVSGDSGRGRRGDRERSCPGAGCAARWVRAFASTGRCGDRDGVRGVTCPGGGLRRGSSSRAPPCGRVSLDPAPRKSCATMRAGSRGTGVGSGSASRSARRRALPPAAGGPSLPPPPAAATCPPLDVLLAAVAGAAATGGPLPPLPAAATGGSSDPGACTGGMFHRHSCPSASHTPPHARDATSDTKALARMRG